VVEFAGLGPAPFACMLLADLGADVLLVERAGSPSPDPLQLVNRGRSVVQADLKSAQDRDRILALVEQADVLVEGFRPGVMERLGLGPDVAIARNPRLVYGRMTGWGQRGPLAHTAGHDINYIAVTGTLAAIGPRDRPLPPHNLVGDYAGGSLYLVVGILTAIFEAKTSGCGQVVDAAITDGAVHLMTHLLTQQQRGRFSEQREDNMLDGGAPWYGVYETSDGRFVAIGAIEAPFFALLLEHLELDESWKSAQHDRARWPAMREAIAAAVRSRSRDDWTARFDGTDACFSPVLTLTEAVAHPHNAARGNFVEVEGVAHPAVAPRFSRSAPGKNSIRSAMPLTMDAALDRWTTAA
jgi:alpha-methylacyl-CoA racemase